MQVGNLLPVVSWILEWGQRARAVEPPELVERVQKELEGALSRYRDGKKSAPKKATSR
jgi:predicted DNA-binding transcriptional regulator YafY